LLLKALVEAPPVQLVVDEVVNVDQDAGDYAEAEDSDVASENFDCKQRDALVEEE